MAEQQIEWSRVEQHAGRLWSDETDSEDVIAFLADLGIEVVGYAPPAPKSVSPTLIGSIVCQVYAPAVRQALG